MTSREPLMIATPLDAQQSIPAPHRRRTSSSTSTRSLPSKRSPSPIITFSPTSLSSEAKGVKNITRKVIKTLEGLGHLESIEMEEQDGESDDKYDQNEANQVRMALRDGSQRSQSSSSNGSALATPQIPRSATPRKIDWEIPRKLLHSSIGFITLYLYVTNGNVKTVTVVLWTALTVIIPADILRLRSTTFERIFERCLGFLMRESEKKSSNGVIWYIIGVNFALTFYPLDVATVAILILSWADTAASTFGRLFGSRTPSLPPRAPFLRLPLAPRKSVAGFIAATITSSCIAAGFWGWIAPIRSHLSWSWQGGVPSSSLFPQSSILGSTGGWPGLAAVSIVAGLVGGVAEALDLGSLDDNLTLPIISGGCILGFFKLLGLFSST